MSMHPPRHIDRHVHLEGGLDPTWIRARAQEQDKKLPDSLEGLWQGADRSFEDFIESFYSSLHSFVAGTPFETPSDPSRLEPSHPAGTVLIFGVPPIGSWYKKNNYPSKNFGKASRRGCKKLGRKGSLPQWSSMR